MILGDLKMARASSEPKELFAVNLRVRGETRSIIDRAASLLGRSRSDFMIEASRRAAEDAILDQTVIATDRASFDRFVAILDRPPETNEKLRKMLRAPAPWESQ
jgi:uncharacterized protein (DUF1778 family)